ncbi:hypothetical protein CHUAL_008559 [Chamberlinius hualienensis]
MNLFWIVVGLLAAFDCTKCQGDDKLREDTTVDIAHYGEIKTAITTNRTKAFLSCESGDMIVTIDFKDPFFGIIYANRDPLSPCNVEGNGKTAYTLRLPLRGCGTREDPPRTFINDIVVRFRRGLIVDEDEVKTIICRYGPPVPPPILPPVPPPLPEPPGIVAKPKKLTEAEIYVIICFLLFLALLLLGVGLAYYCLKKRNIKIVRKRRAYSSAPASEITKLSGSTMGTLSAFDGFRIPRATAHSTSGSEAALLTQDHISDTIPSDYPSESPSSDTEEMETRRDTTMISETSTIIDDNYRYDRNLYIEPPVQSQPRSLTTIYEQDYLQRIEDHDESVLSARRLLQHQMIPPVYAKIRKKQFDTTDIREETILDSTEEYNTRMRFAPLPPPLPMSIPPRMHTATVSEARSVSEYVEDVPRLAQEPLQLPQYMDEVDAVVPLDVLEPPVLSRGPPATTRHTIDDYYLTTITESHTHEDETKHRRETTHTHVKEPPMPTKWDVMIRTYPPEFDENQHRALTVTTDSETNDQWEQLSYVSERPQGYNNDSDNFAESVPPPLPNWNVLIRVLKPNLPSEPSLHGGDDDMESVDELSEDDRERWRKIITTDTTLRTRLQEARTVEELENIRQDRRYETLFEPQKWDVIIRILSEPAEPDRARSDSSSTISEAAPSISSSHSGTSGQYPPRRYRKKSDPFDNRSRRSSLPPVYEYEDFNVAGTITPTTTRSRRTSRSSDFDFEDENEEAEEDEVRYERRRVGGVTSNWSVDSDDVLNQYLTSGRGPIARSIAERSTTEVIENISRVYEQPRSPSTTMSTASQRHLRPLDDEDELEEGPYERITPHRSHTAYSAASSTARNDHSLGGHRQIERSSTEILVSSPSMMRMAASRAASSHQDERYSIPETEISGYMR